MKFVVDELTGTPISQVVTPVKNTIVVAIRPHIYRHNLPTGNLKLQIYDQSATLIAESELIAISNIEGSFAFFHGYVRFDINAYLAGGQAYTIKLVGQDGYSFNESAYCGWVNGLDLGKYPSNTVPSNTWVYPLDLEIWEREVV